MRHRTPGSQRARRRAARGHSSGCRPVRPGAHSHRRAHRSVRPRRGRGEPGRRSRRARPRRRRAVHRRPRHDASAPSSTRRRRRRRLVRTPPMTRATNSPPTRSAMLRRPRSARRRCSRRRPAGVDAWRCVARPCSGSASTREHDRHGRRQRYSRPTASTSTDHARRRRGSRVASASADRGGGSAIAARGRPRRATGDGREHGRRPSSCGSAAATTVRRMADDRATQLIGSPEAALDRRVEHAFDGSVAAAVARGARTRRVAGDERCAGRRRARHDVLGVPIERDW